jgi:hypothetical protein
MRWVPTKPHKQNQKGDAGNSPRVMHSWVYFSFVLDEVDSKQEISRFLATNPARNNLKMIVISD